MACQSQRGSCFFPTKLHISSTSASSTRLMMTSTSPGFNRRKRGVLTDSSAALFFQFVNYCGRANLQHACRIADATAIEDHLDYLLFDRGEEPPIGRIEKEGLVGARWVLTPIALLPGIMLATYHHLTALAIGAENGNTYHDSPPEKRASACHPEQ